jgi:hypothetical protein
MGKKRKGGGQGGGWGGDKKHKYGTAPARGVPAILCMCDQHREKEAVADLVDMLNEYTEELGPMPPKGGTAGADDDQVAEAGGDGGDAGGDAGGGGGSVALTIQQEIAQEIADMKKANKPSNRRFSQADTGCKGMLMYTVKDKRVDPVALVRRIFEDTEKAQARKSRYCSQAPLAPEVSRRRHGTSLYK